MARRRSFCVTASRVTSSVAGLVSRERSSQLDGPGLQSEVTHQDGDPGFVVEHELHTEISVQVHGRTRFSVSEGVRADALAHLRLAIASNWMFSRQLENGRVSRVLTEWKLPSIDLWAVYPSGRMASAKARQFAAVVAAQMAG